MFARDGRAERDEAINRVAANTDPGWKQEARAVVANLAYEMERFTTDDVWDRLTLRPREPRALGAVMTWAANRGYIVSTEEMRESERPEAHRNPKRVWQSLVCRFKTNRVETSSGRVITRTPRSVPKPVSTAEEFKPKTRGASSTGKGRVEDHESLQRRLAKQRARRAGATSSS